MGVSSREDLTLIEREALNIESTVGAYILVVTANSPADVVGLRGGVEETSIPGLYAGGDFNHRGGWTTRACVWRFPELFDDQ